MTMKKYIASGFLTLAVFVSIGFATPTFAQTTDVAAQIQALLAQVKALQAQIAQLQGQPASTNACISLSYNLYADQTDARTNGEVTKLQQFLAQDSSIYPAGLITGYFGPMTETAVQHWQARSGVVSSGSPGSTGYGYVGPRTRAAMSCGGSANSVIPNTTPTNTNPIQPTPTPLPSPTPTLSPVPSVYLYANPTSIISDGKPGTITLHWSSVNATYCNFEKSKLSPSGSMVVSLSQTTTYTISCTGPGGTNSSNPVTVSFQLSQPSPTTDLKINSSDGPLAKTAGYSTFSWASSNSDYCTASGDTYWSGTKSTSGSEAVWTGNEKTGITTYQLTCGASSGKVSPAGDSVTVTFLQPSTVDLKINNSDGPLTKSAGYSTFSWTSTNADYCTASGDTYWSGAKSTSGSKNIWTGNEKTGITTYQLTCGASSGKTDPADDSVTVNFSY